MIKRKYFYSHLISAKEILNELDKFGLDHEEADEIHHLIDDIVHHRVLDALLKILPDDHHEEFIGEFTKNPLNPDLMEYLKTKSQDDPEIRIITVSQVVKQEIMLDVLLAKPKRKSKKPKYPQN